MIARKFYKIDSLEGVFKRNLQNVYITWLGNTEQLDTCFTEKFLDEDGYREKIDKHTILFITAAENDRDKCVRISKKNIVEGEYEPAGVVNHILSPGDTMIWARGSLYGVSTKAVKTITLDSQDNSKAIITYTDGTHEKITFSQVGVTGSYPIGVNDNTVSLEDISIDENLRNIIFNTDKGNSAVSGVIYAHIEGNNNQANNSYQHIEGQYADTKQNYAFIIGNGSGDNNRSNLFVITFDGNVFSKDFTAGGTIDNPFYKLSDIHSVLDADWTTIGTSEEDDSFDDDYYDPSFQ